MSKRQARMGGKLRGEGSVELVGGSGERDRGPRGVWS